MSSGGTRRRWIQSIADGAGDVRDVRDRWLADAAMSAGVADAGDDDWAASEEDYDDSALSLHRDQGHHPHHRPSGLPDPSGPYDHRDVSALPATAGARCGD
jgi:hypothetical protein